jgi:hypothetical protein
MPYYKDTSNILYFLNSSEFEHLIPSDCVDITDEEAQVIQVEFEANQPAILPPIPPTVSELQAQLITLQKQINLLSE